MKVNQSAIINQVKKVLNTNIGELYFFNNIVISEFNEGVHVSFENSTEVIQLVKDYFGASRPFGFISNMINSYSIEPLDTPKFGLALANMAAYGAVSYNKAAEMNVEIENSFCENKILSFDDLYQAADAVYKKVKQVKIPVD